MTPYKIAFSGMKLTGKIERDSDLWNPFNRSFRNVELPLIEIANEIYQGHAFTTWHKDGWRSGKNYLLGQHLGLDFDTEDERSTLPYLAKEKFISKYAALIYTTPSHKPEAPRARALFLLDAPIYQAKNYTLAASALVWLFGAEADRKCKDACRFFYGSEKCEVEYLDNVLPLEKVKALVSEYQAATDVQRRRHERRTYTPTADQQEVADALKCIPAMQIEYDEWVSVLMAIHGAFGNGGLALADQWAQGYDGEVERKWRSFNENGNGSGQVTLGTLFMLARRFGYQGDLAKAA
jgi:hypothetical protein